MENPRGCRSVVHTNQMKQLKCSQMCHTSFPVYCYRSLSRTKLVGRKRDAEDMNESKSPTVKCIKKSRNDKV